MAVDNWTINLECDGKAQGHKHVQREMDRDEICFFDLIDLIEGSGYTSVDYLYYKRKDSLVVIQQDYDVMEMLNECDGDEVPGKRKGTVLTHVWDLLGGDRIVTKFLYPHSCEKWILKSIGRDWRKYKATLKKSLFNPKKKKSILNKCCPDDIDEDQWKALVKYWKSSEEQTLSEKNKISFQMKKTTHTAGTKSYARWSEDMVELENLLDTQPELAQNSEGGVAWEETHILEEIRQLKEHSRMQDKAIEELKNNQRHHENQEATMGNCARSDHNNSQNQAVLSKRKRVHCVAPNQNDGFLEHRDELNKETCESEYSDDEVYFYPPQVKQQRNKRVIMEGLLMYN
ncbi:unnamed protein product [Miscanthus lutarioriparius]|uniref:PB1-like domain-containing protein n=1 Tax=Miscanthus lutarioriparius TaxID=422564 RepID=A0A811MJM1_9POAL|nr:unnamed protein product [Miscanthus lutarioriparius]